MQYISVTMTMKLFWFNISIIKRSILVVQLCPVGGASVGAVDPRHSQERPQRAAQRD